MPKAVSGESASAQMLRRCNRRAGSRHYRSVRQTFQLNSAEERSGEGLTNMSIRYAKVAGIVVLVVLLASLIAYAVAQPPGGGFQGGQRNPGMMRGMRGGGSVAIAVADGTVFVIANNMLLKYDAKTLELLAQAELPRPTPPAGMPAPGGQ